MACINPCVRDGAPEEIAPVGKTELVQPRPTPAAEPQAKRPVERPTAPCSKQVGSIHRLVPQFTIHSSDLSLSPPPCARACARANYLPSAGRCSRFKENTEFGTDGPAEKWPRRPSRHTLPPHHLQDAHDPAGLARQAPGRPSCPPALPQLVERLRRRDGLDAPLHLARAPAADPAGEPPLPVLRAGEPILSASRPALIGRPPW